jgi:predicted PurR-regulated permease PerM
MNRLARKEEPSPAPEPDERAAPVDVVKVTGSPEVVLTGLFVLAILYTLHAAREILLPVILALLLALILSPAVRGLKRLRLPEPVGAALVVATLVASLGFGLSLLIDPATQWIERAPRTLDQVERKLRGIKRSVEELSKAADKVDEMTTVEAKKKTQPAPAAKPSLLSRIFTGTQSVVISAAATLVLLYFLLASGDMFLRKVVRVASTLTRKKRAVEVARAVQSDMTRYLLTITCINVGLGLTTGIAMYFLGMPNPFLWGAMAALLNFLPYIGAASTLVILTIVAFLTFDGAAQIIGVPLVFLGLTALEGQFLTPILTGRSLTLNPVVIFLSMLFWAWLWGAVGALVAVPILMTFKILCDHIETLAPVGEFLSGKQTESEEPQ